MKTTKGRPKKVITNILKPELLDKFIQRVYNGQSIYMLCWEFKISQFEVRQLCKEHNLIVNSGDSITFGNKMHGRGV